MNAWLLLLPILVPLIGALVPLLPVPDFNRDRGPWAVALFTSLATLVISVVLLFTYRWSEGGSQLDFTVGWLPELGLNFALAVDGVSIWLVALTALITPIAVIVSRGQTNGRPQLYYLCLLMLEAALMGTFLASDLLLFYIFFELALVPVFLLIITFGTERRRHAATLYFLYAFAGSMLTLAAILYLGLHHFRETGAWSFALADLQTTAPGLAQIGAGDGGFWTPSHFVLVGLLAGFLVKVPAVPFHGYLPVAHRYAPAHGAVDLAGLVLKLGPFAILKFAIPLCPQAVVDLAPAIGLLAVTGILAAGLVCWRQEHAKELLAYSSVSHMGFVLLGLFALDADGLGSTGAMFYIFSYTISAGALFLMVGMLHQRVGSFRLSDTGGLGKVIPVWTFFAGFFVMASVGLPGLNGFVGEALTMAGAFLSPDAALGPWYAGFAVAGVVIAAIYLLTFFGKLALGPLKLPTDETPADLTPKEIGVLAPLAVLCLVLGLMPAPVLDSMSDTTQSWTAAARQAAVEASAADDTEHPHEHADDHDAIAAVTEAE